MPKKPPRRPTTHVPVGRTINMAVGRLTPLVSYRPTGAVVTTRVTSPTGSSGEPPPPPPSPDADADFLLRRTSAGVIRWFDFNDESSLGPTWTVTHADQSLQNYGVLLVPAVAGIPGQPTRPVIDNQVFCSGTASLRFDRPSMSISDIGAWFCNFSSDLQTQLGANQEIFVQWRERWNQAMCDTPFYTYGGDVGGIMPPASPSFVYPTATGSYIDLTHIKAAGDQRANLPFGITMFALNAGNAAGWAQVLSTSYDAGSDSTTITHNGAAPGSFAVWDAIRRFAWQWIAVPATLVDATHLTFAVDPVSVYGTALSASQGGDVSTPTIPLGWVIRAKNSNLKTLAFTPCEGSTYSNGVTTVTVRVPQQGTLTGLAYIDIGPGPNAGGEQAGIKHIDLAGGDQYGGPTPDGNGISHMYSSGDVKPIVVNTWHQGRMFSAYGYVSSIYEGEGGLHATNTDGTMHDLSISGDQIFQNAYNTGTSCVVSTLQGKSGDSPSSDWVLPSRAMGTPGCFNMVPNEWVTVQIGVQLGDREQCVPNDTQANPSVQWNPARYRMWVAREGQPSQLVLDFNGFGPNPTPGFVPTYAGRLNDNWRVGKVWLFPYNTAQEPTQEHPLCQIWYDELIISRNRIPDPMTPGVGYNPTLASIPANTAVRLGDFVYTEQDPIGNSTARTVHQFSSMAYDQKRGQMVIFGGGHSSTNYNAINCFRPATLDWQEEFPPTPNDYFSIDTVDGGRAGAYVAMGNENDPATVVWNSLTCQGTVVQTGPTPPSDGPYPRPLARHTLGRLRVVGDELIIMSGVEGMGAAPCNNNGSNPNYWAWGAARFAHWNFATQQMLISPAVSQIAGYWTGAAIDPVTNWIVFFGQNGIEIYDPVACVKTHPIDITSFAGQQQYFIDGSTTNHVPGGSAFVGYNMGLTYCPLDDNFYYFDNGSGDGAYKFQLNRVHPERTKIYWMNTCNWHSFLPAQPSFDWDSKNRKIIGAFNATVYIFDPLTKQFTSQPMPGFDQRTASYDSTSDTFRYDPVNNVFIFLSDNSSGRINGVWAYRYA